MDRGVERGNMMKVVYFAPRYHTNQIPIMRGWLKNGHSVHFVSQYQGKTEDYSVLTPIILGYSKLFHVIDRIIGFIKRKDSNSSNVEYFQTHYGFPSAIKVRRLLKELQADVIIMRDRSIYNVVVYHEAKKMKIPCILYNQTPYWETEEPKNDILHRIIRKNCPGFRITPVWGDDKEGHITPHSYYVPFVMDEGMAPEEKCLQAKGESIKILCIGKYETRKNQLMLLEIFNELVKKYPIELILVGEVSTNHHKAYYQRVCDYIEQNNLEQKITLKTNLSRKDVDKEYIEADLFVLPSTKEFASVSQLEAMAYSLPIICSDKNGTSKCVENGVNGFLFKDNDKESLREALVNILQDRDRMTKMGQRSYELIKTVYSFEEYYKSIRLVMNDMENQKG